MKTARSRAASNNPTQLAERVSVFTRTRGTEGYARIRKTTRYAGGYLLYFFLNMSQITLVLRYNICRDDNKGGEMMPKTDDASKIAELYSMYEQKMFYEARGILNDDQLAEDAVQEAFLKLIRHRDRLSTLRPQQISSYVWQTLRSTAIDIYRKNKRERERICDIEEAEKIIGESDSLNDGVISLIDDLPPKYKAIAVCRLKHGLSVKETASVLKLTESCVRKRYERARKLLAEILEDTM